MSEGITTIARGRRFEDQEMSLVLALPPKPQSDGAPIRGGSGSCIEIRGMRINLREDLFNETGMSGRDAQGDAVLLLDFGDEEAILVTGASVGRIPRGHGGQELVRRAAVGASVWSRERNRTSRRALLPEMLIGFSEQLNRAETELEVCRALVEFVPRIAGGYAAVVMLPQGESDELHAVEIPHAPYEARQISLQRMSRFSGPGTITRDDARPDTGSPFSGLGPLMRDLNAAVLAHVPFDTGVLMLAERRGDRVFGAEEWDLLGTLSRQADAALKRVRLFHEVHSLSLADPLTGLANRRQMKLVLDRGMAAARRGEGLAVVMFDLDDFKIVNDVDGHVAGDRILVSVAEVLRREARGADLVVRYGGDEFLVVLPGGTAQGASAFVRRVRERLEGQVELSAGVAEYAPHLTTVEQIIEAADRNLYLAKQHRKQWKDS
jgi:diguanylate cyclase (GGDEF)-like protein